MNLDEFAKLVERSVRAQLRAGRRVVASSWGNVNRDGDDIDCGCAVTLLVREQFGAEEALYIVRNEDDEEANDRFIADLFDCQPSSIREFRIGFDGILPRRYEDEWTTVGRRACAVFVVKDQATSLTAQMMFEEMEKLLGLVKANPRWFIEHPKPFSGIQSVAFFLGRADFAKALECRRAHAADIAATNSVLDKWLTEFFGE